MSCQIEHHARTIIPASSVNLPTIMWDRKYRDLIADLEGGQKSSEEEVRNFWKYLSHHNLHKCLRSWWWLSRALVLRLLFCCLEVQPFGRCWDTWANTTSILVKKDLLKEFTQGWKSECRQRGSLPSCTVLASRRKCNRWGSSCEWDQGKTVLKRMEDKQRWKRG